MPKRLLIFSCCTSIVKIVLYLNYPRFLGRMVRSIMSSEFTRTFPGLYRNEICVYDFNNVHFYSSNQGNHSNMDQGQQWEKPIEFLRFLYFNYAS